MSRLLSLYHRLPAGPAKTVAASLRGAYLRAWRYGPETARLVEEALARDLWSSAQWKSWQEERLARVLHRAATHVPYYRDQWNARRRKGDRAPWDVVANWPVLTKQAVREHPTAFLADDCNRRFMLPENTSGTTGTPLRLWWSRDCVRQWYALFEARCRRWHGLSRHDRWAIFGGQLVVPTTQRRPPFWVWNAALNQLYMSVYHLAPESVPSYLGAMRRFGVRYALGYTSALESLARGWPDRNQPAVPLTVALTNAEPVMSHQRELITAALHCPLRETYGMTELVAAASECGSGQLHLWPEVGWVEVVRRDIHDRAGDLICTGLLNADMPLVRYEVGDRAALSLDHSVPCPCGRTLPRLESIEGRADDVLYTRDGRPVGRLDPIFKAAGGIREAQIVQETLDRVRVRLVPSSSYRAAHGGAIARELRLRMGAVEVIIEEVETIARSANGKFRAVVSRLPPHLRVPHR